MSKKVRGPAGMWARHPALKGGLALLAAGLLWAVTPKIVSHLAREHMATVILWLDSERNEIRLADAYERAIKLSQVKATLEEAAPSGGSSGAIPWLLSVRATTSTQALNKLQAFISALRAEYNSRGPGALRIAPDRHTFGISTGTMRRTTWIMTFAEGGLGGTGLLLLGLAGLRFFSRREALPDSVFAAIAAAFLVGGSLMLWMGTMSLPP